MLDIFKNRCSVRNYTDQEVSKEDVLTICKAGLSGPSGKGLYPLHLLVVRNKDLLFKLSKARTHGSSMLENAQACVIVLGKTDVDTWIEDCSVCMTNMSLQATSMGIGSCWIQVRNRNYTDSISTESYIKDLLGIASVYSIEAMLSLGYPESVNIKNVDNSDLIIFM